MSTEIEKSVVGGLLFTFLPDEIQIDETVNVRPYSKLTPEAEELEMESLAASIEAEGQLQPVRVRLIDNVPHLIMGERRVRAIHRINMKNGESPLKVQAVVVEGVTDSEAFRQAAIENLQRRAMTPMDLAGVIERVRKENGWTGVKNTAKVAEFLKVSSATVTQHEKLLKLTDELKARVHKGELSGQAAMELQANVKPEEQEKVIEDAKIEQQQAVEEHQADVKAGKKVGKGKAERKTGAVTVKHIRKASRKRDAMLSIRALTKPEVNDPWVKLRDAIEKENAETIKVWGYKDGKAGLFVRNFVGWLDGKVKTPTMMRDVEVIVVAALGKGGLSKGSKAEKVVEKAAKGKAAGKGKASPKPKK